MNAPAPTAANDAALKTFTASVGKLGPSFWSERTLHAIHLPSHAASLSVTPAAAQPDAAIQINGKPARGGEASAPIDVPVGRSELLVEVTAPDGTTKKTYTFKLLRAQPLPNWKRVIEHAPFTARDSAGEAVHRGQMFVLGGYIPELVSDVWASRDGVAWTQVGNIPNESGVNIPVVFQFNDMIWVTTQDGKFYRSADGKNWELVSESTPWGKRYAAGHAVFNGKMWVAGGAGGQHAQGTSLHNDVWSSSDGVNWKRELEHAPWSPRQLFGNLVAHHGRLYAIGGGVTSYQPFRAYRDVWSTDNGVDWRLETDAAPFDVRIWSSILSYHGRLWLLGGFEAEPRWTNFNDVWYSTDGRDWRRFRSEDVWSERHEVSPFVHDGKLWVVAGNAWPLVNDVWQLTLDKLTFITQPRNEDYGLAQYRYESRADFHRSCSPVQYKLATAPPFLAIDANTGVVTGRLPASGRFDVVIEARSADGETATQRYTLHVIP